MRTTGGLRHSAPLFYNKRVIYTFLRGAVLAFAAFLFFSASAAEAQASPAAVLTWHTTAFAPSDFRGKIFPTSNSYLTGSLVVISQGKVVPLTSQEVRWYVDDELVRSGTGLDSISFRAPATLGVLDLRAEVPGLDLLRTVEIPLVSPKVSIKSPYTGTFSTASPVFRAQGYFFNVVAASDLVTSWQANGDAPSDTESPEFLKVSVLPGTPANFILNLSLLMKNPKNILEAARGTLTLTYSPR
jgi:hypothetical protein